MLHQAILVLLTIAVGIVKLGQGFDFDYTSVFTRKNNPTIIKGLIVGVVLVPVLFALLIVIFQPTQTVIAVLIIMAVSPAADMSIQQVKKLGGSEPIAEGMQAISTIICIITIPLFIRIFDYFLGINLKVDFFELLRTIAVAQIIPLAIGMTLRKFFPQYAKLAKTIVNIGIVFVIVSFVFAIMKNYRAFAHFSLHAYMVCSIATFCAFCLGVIFSKKTRERQLSFAIVISLRDPGMAYLIASLNFDIARVNLAMLPYIITTLLTVTTCAMILKQTPYFSKQKR